MNPEVVIVGAGPVGLMLAAELRAWDVRTMVLEERRSVDTRLRAPSITERTVEAVERHGLIDRLCEEVERYHTWLGRPISVTRELRVDGVRALPIRQEILERVLEDHVRTLGADLRRGHRVLDVSARSDSVALQVGAPDGEARTVEAGYVAGCDGGRSIVRTAAGVGFPGRDPGVTGYQVEAVIDGVDLPTPGWHRTPNGIAAFKPYPNGGSDVVSVEFNGPPRDRSTKVTVAEAQASIRRTSGKPVRLTNVTSLTRFTDNERLADTYHLDRIVFAGDAAHVHAPFGGQGLNLGIQDAINLGWKLAGVVQGWALPRLLETYTAERRPVAQQVLESVRTAVTVLAPDPARRGVWELFEELQQLDAVRRYMHEKTAMVNVRYSLDGLPEGQHPLVGQAPRQLQVRTGNGPRTLGEVMPPGRGLLLVLSTTWQRAARVASGWRGRVGTVHGELGPIPTDGIAVIDERVGAVLLRPDGFVCWIGTVGGSQHPAPLETVLDRWLGPANTSSVAVHEWTNTEQGGAMKT